jgi:hypothetical protein
MFWKKGWKFRNKDKNDFDNMKSKFKKENKRKKKPNENKIDKKKKIIFLPGKNY